ncbi:FMN-binding glutamate synthase family protein [Sediminibacterium ginsengisoli]|uniref:Glutamate synthase domain-containing protein 2 n=1 Tax=Sediminibacterium ginsengisoli TaxID=413434 RepID=A0A1T4L6X3_9BACT|nr:FMN-binding glutamate synthase family protein [Sediminibacterium ginsengisoli]SJZ50383.1 Glutamate synthase domain-containing protein 2 [Sediminibacterium ginsengisoli]
MSIHKKNISVSGTIIAILVLLNTVVLKSAFVYDSNRYWLLCITLPLLLLALYDVLQKKHALRRNYPILAHFRYMLENIRPEIRQYFFEDDLNGKPFNRRQRSIVYQRSKNQKQTVAFGMQADPSAPGYEWVGHSIYPVSVKTESLRVKIGHSQCSQPYVASIFNIGAMSYGALSKTAVTALNEGAALGGFAQNTGEGGISDYHMRGGDLIWQIGTGYFGCRNENGGFHMSSFRQKALLPNVKMIEVKLSQGAKPGKGGILPAAKNTQEIAAIRNVAQGTTIHSPARHSAFDGPVGLLKFLQLLRNLSEGKPVGFKLCIGDKQEFIDICDAMVTTGILPDFICVDGAEGGTGAAPLEFTDHLGMPLYEGLTFVRRTLDAFGFSEKIRIIAAGKIITGFDILKALALGASACYSARGMMFALGCIQALKCDSDKCPAGVATQDETLYNGLDVTDKKNRVASFHANTLAATKEIMEACGFSSPDEIKAARFFRRVDEQRTRSFEEIYFAASRKIFKQDYQQLN